MNLLDLLLFPRELYRKLNDRKLTLYLGVIFIGIVDVAFMLDKHYTRLFADKSGDALIYRIALLCLLIVAIGVIDVIFTCVPLFDLFKKFKAEPEAPVLTATIVRLMKAYIMSHFILIPVEAVLYLAKNNINMIPKDIIFFAGLIGTIIPFWFSAIITRGINTIYSFQPFYRSLVFMVVFIWTSILGWVLSYSLDNWIMKLF